MKKQMKKKIVSLLLIPLLILQVSSIKVFAPTYSLGIKVGNWVKYTVISNATTQVLFLAEPYETNWTAVNVTATHNSMVGMLVTTGFRNGTQKTEPMELDVENGEPYTLRYLIIASNLDKGDPVYEGSEVPINYTRVRSYANASREVNYVGYMFGQTNNVDYLYIFEFSWDRKTGILVDAIITVVEEEANGKKTLYLTSLELQEINMWQPDTPSTGPPEWLLWMAAIGGISTLTIGLLVYFSKKGRKSRRKIQKR
jgi:hypothetical protein